MKDKKILEKSSIFYLYIHGANTFNIVQLISNKIIQISVFVILFLAVSFADWSIHDIEYKIQFITINKTASNPTIKVVYFIIHQMVFKTHWVHVWNSQLSLEHQSIAQWKSTVVFTFILADPVVLESANEFWNQIQKNNTRLIIHINIFFIFIL